MGNIVTREKGTLYGPEMWYTNAPLTIFIFFILAMIQGGLFFCTAAIIDRCYPRRAAEIYNLEQVGDEEDKTEEKQESDRKHSVKWDIKFEHI